MTNPMRAAAFILGSLLVSSCVQATNGAVYDEKADAGKDITAAVANASRAGKRVILVFGANWCFDCRTLDAQMHKGALLALIEKNFVVVKVDVGRMDKNVDVATKYGVPVSNGIPALAVLDGKGKLLYAQDQGQFSSARRMSHESIKAFFERWKPER